MELAVTRDPNQGLGFFLDAESEVGETHPGQGRIPGTRP